MADETSVGGTPAEPVTQAQPQAGSSPTTATTAGTQAEPNGTPGSETMSLDEARKLRAEHNSLRKRLAEFEKAEADRQAASLSETEKAAKRAEAAETALQQARGRIGAAEVKVASQAAGIIDPDVAVAMLSGKVEYDAHGEPTNVADLVKQLKAEKPHLFAQPSGQQGQSQSQQRPAVTSGGTMAPSASQTPPAPRDLRTQPIRTLSDIQWKR